MHFLSFSISRSQLVIAVVSIALWGCNTSPHQNAGPKTSPPNTWTKASAEISSTFVLKCPDELPYFTDYDPVNQRYISHSSKSKKLYVHDADGNITSTISYRLEGPGKIQKVINAVFDGEEIVVLTIKEIVRFSLEGAEVGRCTFEHLGTFIYGYLQSRILPYQGQYIFTLLDPSDTDLGLGSKAFVQKAGIIKVVDKNDCSCTQKINYPPESVFHKGVFQSTMYEPHITLDEKNKELLVMFPIDPHVYIYDLATFALKKSLPVPTPIEMDFPLPTPFEEAENAYTPTLIRRFQSDNQKNMFMHLEVMGDQILIGLKKTSEQMALNSRAAYMLMNRSGDIEVFFETDAKSLGIMQVKNEKELFGLVDFSYVEEEPEGFPLFILSIRP